MFAKVKTNTPIQKQVNFHSWKHSHPRYFSTNLLQGKKGVFFDGNGVLYRRRANKILTIRQFLLSKGFDPSKFPEEQDCYDKLLELKLKAGKGEAKKETFYRELLQLHSVTDPDLMKEGVTFIMDSISRIILNEGVPHTISTLPSLGYKIGVITNSMSSKQEKLDWFANVGLNAKWDGFVSSKEVGVKKPHPLIYLKCLEEAQVHPDQAIFVGHSKEELDGAKSLGITTCMVNRDHDAIADFDLHSNLANLLSLLPRC